MHLFMHGGHGGHRGRARGRLIVDASSLHRPVVLSCRIHRPVVLSCRIRASLTIGRLPRSRYLAIIRGLCRMRGSRRHAYCFGPSDRSPARR
uniref:Uncharacterized protein n=2 Tax=Aromatoleum anaerobium TaxID=182180 RepID=A0ABX1PTR0_9RHOO